MSKNTRRDGGPAFPMPGFTATSGGKVETLYAPMDGMTLRDYFAAKALPLARETLPEWDLKALFGASRTGIRREEILAAQAYRIADAMLAERTKDGAA